MSDTIAAYVGGSLPLPPHAKAVLTIAISLDKPFVLELHAASAAPDRHEVAQSTIIRPRQMHRIIADGEMLFIYADASLAFGDSDDGRLLPAAATVRDIARSGATSGALMAAAASALDLMPTQCRNAKLNAVLDALHKKPETITTVRKAAAMAGVSPSHFQRMFRETCGVPFRPYRLWQRMRLAVGLAKRGANLTEAALHAGFSSSAHFSQSFRQMFGLPFSMLLNAGVKIEDLQRPTTHLDD